MPSNVDSLVSLLVVAFVLLFLAPVLVMLLFTPVMGMGWWAGGPIGPTAPADGFGGSPPALTLSFWAGGIALALGLGYLGYRAVTESGADPALGELKKAYDRGDLTREEYEERLEGLQR